jgi:hypothetical protein
MKNNSPYVSCFLLRMIITSGRRLVIGGPAELSEKGSLVCKHSNEPRRTLRRPRTPHLGQSTRGSRLSGAVELDAVTWDGLLPALIVLRSMAVELDAVTPQLPKAARVRVSGGRRFQMTETEQLEREGERE